MATASVIDTVDPRFSSPQLISSDQGNGEIVTSNPFFTAHLGPAKVYRMRAWDTVASAYVRWTSYGDPNTPAPTLNPVTGVTATLMTRPRTV